ncbi:MAG TPA: Rieske 2Fe-2S domain-containing protein [Gemmatimonadaceae bacterium]|nr:Rieske 2Fe-2S domain-containing protein [Gemmatimonadaceae bacterium]
MTDKHDMRDSDGFETLATIHEIPDEGVLAVVKSDGRRICLIRSRGRVSAVSDNCTHQDFEMSLGDVLPDGTIQCAWHGARFDCASGEVKQGPAPRPLPVFAVRMEGNDVLVGPEIQNGATP